MCFLPQLLMLALGWDLYGCLEVGLVSSTEAAIEMSAFHLMKKVFLRFLVRAAVSLLLDPSLDLSSPSLLSSKIPPWPTVFNFRHGLCSVCSNFWVGVGEGSCFLSCGSPCCPFVLWVHKIGPSPLCLGSPCLSPTQGWHWAKELHEGEQLRRGVMEHFPQTALSSLHTNPITNKLAHEIQAWELFGSLSSLADSFKPAFFKNPTPEGDFSTQAQERWGTTIPNIEV